MLARSVEATTILAEGKGPTKGEAPCFILHTGISPEGGARALTLEQNETGPYKKKGRNLINAEINQKQGNHPFVDPELRTRSEIETQSRPPPRSTKKVSKIG